MERKPVDASQTRGGGIASGARNLQETRVNATFSLAIAIIKSSWR